MKVSDRRIAALFSLVLASGLCILVLAIRVRYPHGLEFRFLAWNLVLAWIPFLLAIALYDAARRGRSRSLLWALGGAWLLFLPNAPYIVTDFVHVGRVTGVPVWFDAGMIASFAGVGLVLGLGSVLLVQGVIERRFGALAGWAALAPIFLLCSAGMYLGRVRRFNSWDAITQPDSLLRAVGARLADPLARPETIVTLAGVTCLLVVAYLVLYTVSDLRLDHNRSSERR